MEYLCVVSIDARCTANQLKLRRRFFIRSSVCGIHLLFVWCSVNEYPEWTVHRMCIDMFHDLASFCSDRQHWEWRRKKRMPKRIKREIVLIFFLLHIWAKQERKKSGRRYNGKAISRMHNAQTEKRILLQNIFADFFLFPLVLAFHIATAADGMLMTQISRFSFFYSLILFR